MGVGVAHTLIALDSSLKGLSKLDINPVALDQDLEESWEVLAEPIQTVMRRYGIDNAYEQLKELTRGQNINKETLSEFIDTLNIPKDAKARLLKMTPQNYIGNAEAQAKQISN